MCSSAQEHISILVGWEWSSGAPGGEGASGVWGPLLEAFGACPEPDEGVLSCAADKKERSRENPSWKREGRRWQKKEPPLRFLFNIQKIFTASPSPKPYHTT